MKIRTLTLQNFRCFRDAAIDLSADVVAIYGRNGVGKTTVFDALEFGLLGNIGRFVEETNPPNYLPYVFSDGEVRIRIDFDGDTEEWIEICRDRSPSSHVAITSSGGWENQRDLLYGLLVNEDYLPPRREVAAIAELFRSTILLSQESIRHFIDSNPDERARILAYLAGSAYFQRCLDKAKDVSAEATEKAGQKQLDVAEAEAKVIELESQIAEQEGRIRAHRERLGQTPITYPSVLEALRIAGVPVIEEMPENEGDAELLSAGIRGACSERIAALDKARRLLAELEAMSLQHPSRLKRRQDLIQMIDKAKEELINLLHQENSAADALKELDRHIVELGISISEHSRRLQALQQLPELQHSHAGLTKTHDDTRKEIEEILKAQSAVRAEVERLETRLRQSKDAADESRAAVQHALSRLNSLDILRASLSTHSDATARIDQADLEIRLLERKRDALQKRMTELHESYSQLNDRNVQLDRTVSMMRASLQEASELIVRLRQYASGSQCPLCGHTHPSHEALQQAIESQLKDVPANFQEGVKQLQDFSTQLAGMNADLTAVDKELKQVDGNLQTERVEREKASSVAREIEADASRLGAEINVNSINELMHSCQVLLAESQDTLRQREQVVQEDEDRLKEAAISARSLDLNLDSKNKIREETQSKLDAIDSRVRELGISDENQLAQVPLSQLSEAARTGLVNLEKEKANQEILRGKAQGQWESSRAERVKVEKNLKEWEQTLAALTSDIEGFRSKSKALQLAADVSTDALAGSIARLSQERDSLDAALRLADRYASSRKLVALEKERDELRPELETAKESIKKTEEEIGKLREASKEAAHWTSRLAENVDRAVKERIARYQPEIGRLFKAMIPSPYPFDRVVMRSGKNGLELGIRYRGKGEDAGEPRFFLSSAQANVLALSIFLSLAQNQRWSKLQSVLLDDPVQHLDDLDAVAFLDELRSTALGRFRPKRQIILSTCDQNLYLLMIRKFDLLRSAGFRFMGISLIDNGPGGPVIHYDIGAEPNSRYAAGTT